MPYVPSIKNKNILLIVQQTSMLHRHISSDFPYEIWLWNTSGMISGYAKTEVLGEDAAPLVLWPPQTLMAYPIIKPSPPW
jgi:hypothetical protein